MNKKNVQDVTRKHLDEIQAKVTPVVIEKVMFSFSEGVEAGMELAFGFAKEMISSWLYSQLHEGTIEVKDIGKLLESCTVFLDECKAKLCR